MVVQVGGSDSAMQRENHLVNPLILDSFLLQADAVAEAVVAKVAENAPWLSQPSTKRERSQWDDDRSSRERGNNSRSTDLKLSK